MSLDGYLTGIIFAGLAWGPAVLIGVLFIRRRLPGLLGTPRVLAFGLIAIGALVGFHLIPGSVGLLSREAVAVTALALTATAWRLVSRRVAEQRPALEPAREESANPAPPSLVIAGVAVAAVTVVSLAAFARLATDAPTHVDALSFGLPGVAEWIRTGSLLEAGSFFPLFQVRTYPNTGDVLYLAGILPFGNDAFLRFTTLPLLALTGLGIYTLAREFGASGPSSALVAALVISMPAVAQPTLTNIKPDVFMYATFSCGLAFLTRHARTKQRSDLLLAGLGIGLAFGSRWYGISAAVVVLTVWVLASLIARRPLRQVARGGAILAATVLAVGGYWLIRNAVLTGNPIYPAHVSLLGVTLFDAPRDVITEKLGFSVAERLGEPGFISNHVWPGLRAQFSLAGLLLVAGAAAGLVSAIVRRRHRPSAGPALAMGAIALLLAGTYAVTPAGAQGFPDQPFPGIVGETARWLVPALLAGAGVAGWALAQTGRLRRFAEAAMAIGVLFSLNRSYDVGAGDLVAVGSALTVLLGAVGLCIRPPVALFRPTRKRPALVAAAAVLLALVAAGYVDQRRYNYERFAGASPVSDWILANASNGHEIGFAGGWQAGYVPIYAAFGPDYGNAVEYVGQEVEGQVREYRHRDAFLAALRRGGYDLLVVGRVARPNLERQDELSVLEQPSEVRWARTQGFSEVVRDGQFILLARESAVG